MQWRGPYHARWPLGPRHWGTPHWDEEETPPSGGQAATETTIPPTPYLGIVSAKVDETSLFAAKYEAAIEAFLRESEMSEMHAYNKGRNRPAAGHVYRKGRKRPAAVQIGSLGRGCPAYSSLILYK